jgi:hypothetical protein
VKFKEQDTRRELFDLKLFPGNDWEAPFYRSLLDAEGVDGVLLMAGAQSVLIAGQIALALPLPVLAVDKFGGSAGIIEPNLLPAQRDYPSSATHSTAQLVTWLRDKCVERAKQLADRRQKEKKILKATSQLEKTVWAGVAFVGLLVAVFLGVAKQPGPDFYPFLTFAGLIAAWPQVAMFPSVIWRPVEIFTIKSVILAGVAGFVVGWHTSSRSGLARQESWCLQQRRSGRPTRSSLCLLCSLPSQPAWDLIRSLLV